MQALSQVFRGEFVAGLKRLFDGRVLKLSGSTAALSNPLEQGRLFNTLHQSDWVVYAKRPFGGPQQVLDYLGRYTHRVAISNHRLVSLTDQAVVFRYRDYAHGNRRKRMSLEPTEFIRRFLLHVLPKGFMRIRHYGLIANRAKHHKLVQARISLTCAPPQPQLHPSESVEAFWLRVASLDIHQCPYCKTGRMIIIKPISPVRARAPPIVYRECA